MKLITRLITAIIFSVLLFAQTVHAKWHTDNQYKFKINVPDNWSSSSYVEGTDKVYDFISPDENIVLQVRAFEASSDFTVDLIASVFKDAFLTNNGKELTYGDYVLNSTKGKMGAYTTYFDNQEVVVACFYAIRGGVGYVLWTAVPRDLFDQKSDEVDRVLNTFTVTTTPAKKIDIASSNKVSITKIRLGDQMTGTTNLTNETSEFNTNTQNFYAVFTWTGNGNGKQLEVRWIFTEANVLIDRAYYDFPNQQGGSTNASVSIPTDGWPEGSYSVEFYLDGNLLKGADFKVVEKKKTPGLSGLIGSTGIKPESSPGSTYTIEMTSDHYLNIPTGKTSTDLRSSGQIGYDAAILEPWCNQPYPIVHGNYKVTNAARFSDVTSPPSGQYTAEANGYLYGEDFPLNRVAVFRLQDGSYAKMIILTHQEWKESGSCKHRVKLQVEYPAFE